ncbi:gluconeogenesis factor YvcK family protein [Helcococcus kunzii]|uniref:gluconeogenesis factor YvcK family protein n=1 Tax=Helcococcus kunzii TaxID=40091 RepID=UPI001C9746F4|nr:gluconeogenesis factor YvcK family protein [Helcococcus kunzii]QZO75611.1 YvcK family protein [Helcococcus kunzii]
MKKTRIWPEPKVVVIGGGSGVSTILPGIKEYTSKLTAIITVSDDGGSTGRLREDLGIIAPGDLRNCLVSLANTDEEMRQLFDYRFEKGELKGHSFGNLFIAAMSDIYKDFGKAIYKAAEILTITGKVLPITIENTELVAELENGELVVGESIIPEEVSKQKSKINRVHLKPRVVEIFEDARHDIENADIIILGPGSLYTSIMPNLLAKDMTELIKSSKAKVYYVVNVVTQKGETDNYTVKDHYDAIIKHANDKIIDAVIVNKEIVNDDILEKYNSVDSKLVSFPESDREFFKKEGIKVIEDDIIEIIDSKIRHDADKLSGLIFSI